MNVEQMTQTADRVAGLMKMLSHPGRLLVLCQLVEAELQVGELARRLGVREASMSQQLGLLRRDGLVRSRRDGHAVYYALARDDVRELIGFLYQTYCANGAAAEERQDERIPA